VSISDSVSGKACREIWEVSLPAQQKKHHTHSTCILTQVPMKAIAKMYSLVPPLRSQILAGRYYQCRRKAFCSTGTSSVILVNHVGHPYLLINGAANHGLASAVSYEGPFDFVEELQVRESDWEVADKHGCVVWVVTQNDPIDF
jgi:hypothetical protein